MASDDAEKAGPPEGNDAGNSTEGGAAEQPRDEEKGVNGLENTQSKAKDEKKPAGGFDATPLPQAPPGYTIKITFHRATNLPMADVNSLSSDPYIIAQMYTDLPTRHKEDPPLRKRTQTIRRSTDPVWNEEWILANVPASGFKLKCRIYDEDPATHDDRLGNAHIVVSQLGESWPGIDNQSFRVMKRSGSKRAYLVRIFATCIGTAKHLSGDLWVSIKMLGRTETDHGGRVYTVGPNWFTRHYSPLLGRIVGTKDEDDGDTPDSARERQRAQKFKYAVHLMSSTLC